MDTGTGIAVAGALVAVAIIGAASNIPKERYDIVASGPAGAFRLDRETGEVRLCYQFGCQTLGEADAIPEKSWSERYNEKHKGE